MAITRPVSISKLDLAKISSWLAGGLPDTEKLLIQLYYKNKKSKIKKLNGLYESMLQITVSQLRNIGSSLTQKTDIESIKAYKKASDMPSSYQFYTNASENLTMAIVHDILTKPDYEHALMTMERWVNICNMCYIQNDFFSTFIIAAALGTYPINRSNLCLNLSPSSRALYKRFESLMIRSEWLAKIHENCFLRKEEYVPSLNHLANSLDRMESYAEERKIDDGGKSEKQRIRLSFSSRIIKVKSLEKNEMSQIFQPFV